MSPDSYLFASRTNVSKNQSSLKPSYELHSLLQSILARQHESTALCEILMTPLAYRNRIAQSAPHRFLPISWQCFEVPQPLLRPLCGMFGTLESTLNSWDNLNSAILQLHNVDRQFVPNMC
ncbi:hypothetical protein PHET_11660 [Paragonimus heterotremus]|uniref:Uncharacterized protein n=1 Tax=Paragonimus heterotremus TaxID=100268 RepID=A0A8J4T0G5_9TREM|nr:hypothetical protein PHET_11660 [Paragonimus heterotremus]